MEGIMDRHSQTGHISQERPLERPSSSQFVTYWRQQGAGWKACLGKRRSEEGRGGLQRFGAVAVCVLRDEDGGGAFITQTDSPHPFLWPRNVCFVFS